MTKEKPILYQSEMVRAIFGDYKTQTRRVVKGMDFEYVQADQKYKYEKRRGVDRLLNGKDKLVEDTPYASYDLIIIDKDGYKHRSNVRHSLEDWVKEIKCPYGQIGDELWVRETFREWNSIDMDCACSDHCFCNRTSKTSYCYRADGHEILDEDRELGVKWTPSIFMPRHASRLQLRIKDVKVERLQDISEDDAMREGIMCQNVIVDVECYGGAPHEITEGRYFNGVCDGVDSFGYETAYDAFKALWVSINGQKSWDENPWVWCIEFERVKP